MENNQLALIKDIIKEVTAIEGFYKEKLKNFDISRIDSKEQFKKLPFTEKNELRKAYPLGLGVVPNDRIVRIHSSSGTTGVPAIIPYTKKDIEDWTTMVKRCYKIAGVTNQDRIQIACGYGLWTAGIGFQKAAESLGAMTIPLGPGNTQKQIQYLIDLKSTVLCATSSYALLLAEKIDQRKIKEELCLKTGILGSERWGLKMRNVIKSKLNIQLYDIYGLTEVYGPGIAISCKYECGMHYFNDYVYFEIIDPITGKDVKYGDFGELVITTLKKEGAPLIRYRTHDLTRFLGGECKCGLEYPRIDSILGRTDDMVKVKGVMLYPAFIDKILAEIDGISSEYQVEINNINGKACVELIFESNAKNYNIIENYLQNIFKNKIGLTIIPKAVKIGTLPRYRKKAIRIIDNRDRS